MTETELQVLAKRRKHRNLCRYEDKQDAEGFGVERRPDITPPQNRKAALQMLDFGSGKITIDEQRITVTSSILPVAVIHGYLETWSYVRIVLPSQAQ